MNVKRGQRSGGYSRSWGNLALDDKYSWESEGPQVVKISVVPAAPKAIAGEDSLNPAKGLVLGIGFSIALWCVIGLVIFNFL